MNDSGRHDRGRVENGVSGLGRDPLIIKYMDEVGDSKSSYLGSLF